MSNDITTRSKNMILGALVADAACMGLHWVYDQAHIRSLVPDTPEFRTPSAADYAGVPRYFAHGTRSAGDQSQYGEQTLVMLRMLAANGGKFDLKTYQAAFQAHFGYGGTYIGYIDHATRETLDNLRRADDQPQQIADVLPFDGDTAIAKAMAVKAQSLIKQGNPVTLRARFESAIRILHTDEKIIAHGFKVLDAVLAAPPAKGANDVQLPATAKLPALIAALVGPDGSSDAFGVVIEEAIRATNDTDIAVAYGQVAAQMMHAAASGGDIRRSLDAGLSVATPQIAADINTALADPDRSVEDVTTQFGLACDLSYAIPSICHNINTAPDFAEAIRANIYAGGDTCGRAIVLGAVMGAVYGVGGDKGIPEDWIDRLCCQADIAPLR